MTKILLLVCKKTFAIGFVIAALALVMQVFEMMRTQSAQGVSLLAYIVFAVLHINGTFYSYFIAKDKMLLFGVIFNLVVCCTIIFLKVKYG